MPKHRTKLFKPKRRDSYIFARDSMQYSPRKAFRNTKRKRRR